MPRRMWTTDEIETLHKLYPDTLTVDIAKRLNSSIGRIYHKAHELGLKKTAGYLEKHGGRLHSGHKGSKATQFKKGHRPHNAGVKGWQAGGNSTTTQFKPGHRGGRALKVYQPIGTERISKDGYLQRKTNDDMPLQKRWKMVHVILWEEHHGPLQKGQVIVFKNGNKSDIRIDNLEQLSRSDLMRRNTIHRYPPELKQTIRLANKVRRKINEKQS